MANRNELKVRLGKAKHNSHRDYLDKCKVMYMGLRKQIFPFCAEWGIRGTEIRVLLAASFFCSRNASALHAVLGSPIFNASLLHHCVLKGCIRQQAVVDFVKILTDKGFFVEAPGPKVGGGCRWLELTGKAEDCVKAWDKWQRDRLHTIKISTNKALKGMLIGIARGGIPRKYHNKKV